MAFKQLGTLAGDVLLKAKAARANQVALKFGAPHLTRREAEGGEALAQSALEPDAQLLNGEGSVSNGNGLPVYIAPRTGKRSRKPLAGTVERCSSSGPRSELVARVSGDQPEPGVNGVFSQRTLPAAKRPVLRAIIGGKLETSIGMRGIRPRGVPASLPRSPMLVIVGGVTHRPELRLGDG